MAITIWPPEVSDVAATDQTLVLGVLNGDRAALAELYDRRARLIRAICFDATHDLEAAADLTQEVFLRAIQKLGGLRDPQRFTAWLVGIARHVCREWRKQRISDRRRHVALSETAAAAAGDAGPDERIAFLRSALGALPEDERLSLQAFYLQGLSAEEARSVLGLSRATLYRVLSRARQRLRAILSRQEVLQ
jgi:RNA polymerase sigma-70 factor, ECF subfamily